MKLMKPLRNRLEEARKNLGTSWEVLEKDYLLSWVLAGISRVEALKDTLIFKGGTALKKCYFGNYRFSEDLDFSAEAGAPRHHNMEQAIQKVCETAQGLLDEYAPVEIITERYTERDPHPGGQEAFNIRAKFPWHRKPGTRVIIEITMDEQVLKPARKRTVLHEYGEPLDTHIKVYALEEIVAEKLRAILENTKQLEERGWNRSRARDYYDLWRIFGDRRSHLDLSDFSTFLKKKCDLRNVKFDGPNAFFRKSTLMHVEKTWKEWLGPLVSDLPPFNTVIDELRPNVEALFRK